MKRFIVFVTITIVLLNRSVADILSASVRQYVVNLHNQFRSQVASGRAVQANGVVMPSAANMQEMVGFVTLNIY